eukprot:PITA_07048
MQHNVPYTPQQNGVVERNNRTLKEMTNCMLQFKGLSLNFWVEAINCANYRVNRTPTKVLKNITPKEAWSSIKPDTSFTYEPSSVDVPPLSIPSTSETISSSDDDNEDENPPPPSQDPPSSPQLPKWVCATRYATGSLTGTSGHPIWDTVMNKEYRSLLVNDTWDLVPLPKGRKLVRCKWVYITKFGPDGKVDKHKARFVAKGFSQVEGIDYTKTFSPIAKMNSIRLVLSLVASSKWEVHQVDVKSVFLHEEIYMEQPLGFIQTDSSLVCQLKKSPYGLKQAPWAWYAKMDSFLIDTGFSRCHSDNTLYTKKVGKSLIILVLYVDDLILIGSDPNLINNVKSSLKSSLK